MWYAELLAKSAKRSNEGRARLHRRHDAPHLAPYPQTDQIVRTSMRMAISVPIIERTCANWLRDILAIPIALSKAQRVQGWPINMTYNDRRPAQQTVGTSTLADTAEEGRFAIDRSCVRLE